MKDENIRQVVDVLSELNLCDVFYYEYSIGEVYNSSILIKTAVIRQWADTLEKNQKLTYHCSASYSECLLFKSSKIVKSRQ